MAERERAWTPGPWQVATNANGIRSIVERAPGDRICSAFFRGEIEGSAAKAEANAALIAAAPDLYEALSDAAKTFRRYEELHKVKGTADGEQKAGANAFCARACEAALAKAEPQTLSPQERGE